MQQHSSKRTEPILILMAVLAIVTVLVAFSWQRQRTLGASEKLLVGRWRADYTGRVANEVYDYVFMQDGSVTTEIVQNGHLVVDAWHGVWKLDKWGLLVEPQGFEAAVALPLTAVGYTSENHPMPLVSWNDGVIVLDRGNNKRLRLTKIE